MLGRDHDKLCPVAGIALDLHLPAHQVQPLSNALQAEAGLDGTGLAVELRRVKAAAVIPQRQSGGLLPKTQIQLGLAGARCRWTLVSPSWVARKSATNVERL